MSNQLATGTFYGRMLRKHKVGGFCLSETQYQLRSTLPRHSHQSPYLGFVLDGRYTETYGRKMRACDSFTLVYHPAGELHEQYFDSNVRLFRIELSDERISELGLMERKWEGSDSRKHRALSLTHRLYQEFRQPDEVSHLAIEGLCLELIAAVARRTDAGEVTSRHVPGWLQQAHELIKSCFLEQLTLRDVARAVKVHPVTLAREFHRYYGCTQSLPGFTIKVTSPKPSNGTPG